MQNEFKDIRAQQNTELQADVQIKHTNLCARICHHLFQWEGRSTCAFFSRYRITHSLTACVFPLVSSDRIVLGYKLGLLKSMDIVLSISMGCRLCLQAEILLCLRSRDMEVIQDPSALPCGPARMQSILPSLTMTSTSKPSTPCFITILPVCSVKITNQGTLLR